MAEIREEQPGDKAGVYAVNAAAFGQAEEARLVDSLRAAGLVRVSLVAEAGGALVGHVLFTELEVVLDAGPVRALALAPLAVAAEWQRRGIGAGLVRRGLELARERGYAAVIVLGDPAYYGRFGFSSELARALASPFRGDAFQAVELVAGALTGARGRVRYPEAFGIEQGDNEA